MKETQLNAVCGPVTEDYQKRKKKRKKIEIYIRSYV